MPGLFDSHAHYDDPTFDGCRDELLTSLFSSGVEYIINAGTDSRTSEASLALAARYPGIYAAVGIHPQEADVAGDDELCRIEAFTADKKAVAIGEIGLDYHYEPPEREAQLRIFNAQLDMAQRLGMPVIIHDREAHGDCLSAVLSRPGLRGVFHSFSGSSETAAELIRAGWYISFSGVITFKNASRVREVLASVDTSRLLIETDCPYMAPVPMRGKLNHSGLMEYTARAAAEILGMTYEQLTALTSENARRLFGIAGEGI